MEQNKRMLEDRDTNFVYLSEWLEKEHPEFFSELTTLFNNIGIEWGLLPHSNDYWCRDFMPLQIDDHTFLKYWYHPSYLLDCTADKQTITNSLRSCKELRIKTKNSTIIIDGGNLVPCGDKIVMTTKVFSENGVADYDPKFIMKLEKFLEHDVIFIPWHQAPGAKMEDGDDVYGHADGMIKYCGDNKILLSYDDVNSDCESAYRILTEHGYEVTKMSFWGSPFNDITWAYINFLQVGDKIIMPKLRIPDDAVAKEHIQKAFPYCHIYQIDMGNIIDEGGALHCLTWNILKNF